MSRILYISPKDNTLKFTNRIYKNVSQVTSAIDLFEIDYSDKSHENALTSISECSKNDLIIFTGHGGSDYLQGSVERDKESYKKERFIDKSNIQVLKNKKFISISCNSSDKLGDLAKENEVISFMGFGDLPTDNEIIEGLNKTLPEINSIFKGELVDILSKSLSLALHNNNSFIELQSLIRFFSNKSMLKILKTRTKHKEILADHIANIAYENKIFGDSIINLIQ
ncbi:MAG: hypothetical protein JXL97_04550 [Bacteroidales bacterium]|nr:hypothetical protein [Bacteroidales bacterium]